MKRVNAACICQTLHFTEKENPAPGYTAKPIADEVADYKAGLDKAGTKYRVLEETAQADGSITVKIIKQYSAAPIGDYLK